MVGQKKGKTLLQAFLYLLPALIVIGVFVVYPLFRTFIMSFYEKYNIYTQTGEQFGLGAYSEVLGDSLFWKSLKNTFVYAIWTVPLSVVISLAIAVALNSKIKASRFFRTAYFLPYVTNVIAIGLAFRFIFHSDYGFLNQLLGFFGINAVEWLNDPTMALTTLIIFGIWGGLAFKIVVFMAGLQGIDPQLYQAARLDEASKWTQFRKITVPQLMPIITYQIIISIIGAFKVYAEVVGLFGDSGPADSAITMVYYIYELFFTNAQYNLAAAASVLMLIVIIFFTIIQKMVISDNYEDSFIKRSCKKIANLFKKRNVGVSQIEVNNEK